MSKENQIEEMDEMLEIIAKAREEYANDVTDHSENEYIREGLINANYRKQSDVIDEFVDRLKNAPIKCPLPLLGLSTKQEIEDYLDEIMISVGHAIKNVTDEMKGE
jgi:hypothetical protein